MKLRRFIEQGDAQTDNFNNVHESWSANDQTTLVNFFSDVWFVCTDNRYYQGNYITLRPL